MVFSSVPAYLDPSNWQPQQINHQININGVSTTTNPLLPPPPPQAAPLPPPPSHPLTHGGPGSGSGSIRPGSMSERARLANITIPEAAQKCPRCESTNTKFCYYNNYSLSQPRHFCKTCRRYWTRGGALRSVPVGGGCRRNKRSKSTSSSKSSPASSNHNNRQTNSSSTSGNNNNNNIPTNYSGNLLNLTPQFQPLRFMSPLSQLSESFAAGDMGLNNYVGGNISSASDQMSFHGASNLMGIEPWKLQQFPFWGGLDPSPAPGLYQYHGGGESGFLGGGGGEEEVRPAKISSSLLSQMASVKMEDNNISYNRNPDLSLSRQLLGGMQENDHHHEWNINNASSGASWTELSSFSSSSTSSHLQ